MAEVMQPFLDALADPNAAALAAKAAGAKVVGYLTNTTPTELIAASGAFPLLLTGSPGDATPMADHYMEPLFDPILRSAFERMLDGRYDFVDAVVLTRTSDSAHRLYYYLTELRRSGVADLPEPLLFDLLHTPWYSSAEYNLRRAGELADHLARIGGSRPDQPALARALADAEDSRGRLRRIVDLRQADPPRIGGADALAVFMAARLMAREAFDAAADTLVTAPPGAPAGVRIVVAGSPLDRPDLVHLIERLGGTVVGDYHALGELMIGDLLGPSPAPLRALVEHYHRGVFSSRTYPQDADAIVRFAEAAGAQGVVFNYYAEEEALTWEYPAQRRLLTAAGFPSLILEDQPYAFDPARVQDRLATFIGGLSSGRAA